MWHQMQGLSLHRSIIPRGDTAVRHLQEMDITFQLIKLSAIISNGLVDRTEKIKENCGKGLKLI